MDVTGHSPPANDQEKRVALLKPNHPLIFSKDRSQHRKHAVVVRMKEVAGAVPLLLVLHIVFLETTRLSLRLNG